MSPQLRRSAAAVALLSAVVFAAGGALALGSPSSDSRQASTCGGRWATGVLTGAGQSVIDLGAVRKTRVRALRSLEAKRGRAARGQGAESTVFEIGVELVGAQLDKNGDIRLIVRDRHPADTMVAELPRVTCSTPSKARTMVVEARRRFVRACGMPARGAVTALTGRARVQGLGFVDRLAGQAGHSPNGLQILPVIRFAASSCSRTGTAPPNPPAPYTPPSRAVHVSTSTQLKSALAAGTSRDIVLESGTYDSDRPFVNAAGHRLWSRKLGGAVLRAGIVLSGQRSGEGGMVRGIAFDVDTPSKTLLNSIVHVWGSARRTEILDVSIDGNMAVGSGIFARQVEGLVIRRVVASRFTDFGLHVDMNAIGVAVADAPLVEDVRVSQVTRPVPRSSNGTTEACVWIGNTATVRRIEVSNCAWEGLWSGTAAAGAVFEDVNSYDNGIGVYLEHYNTGNVIRRLRAGPNVRVGVVCEWADPDWQWRPGCTDVVIEDSYFETRFAGVLLDEGTTRSTVRRSTFVGQCWAGIGDYKGIGNLWDMSRNDFARIAPGAVSVSTRHAYTSSCA